MQLIVISSSQKVENETAIVTELFENGLKAFHLRKPNFSTKDLKNYIKSIPSQYHNRIIIHSHHKIARTFDLKGIHLTKTHKNKKFKTWLTLQLIKAKNPNILITTSYDKLASILDDEEKFSYVFLSPIFDSLTSKYQSGFSEGGLKGALKKTSHRVIARGGIEISNIEKVNEIGFAGMALYSAIWKKNDPLNEFIRIIEKCHELKIDIE